MSVYKNCVSVLESWKRPWGRLLEALRVLMEALRVCRGSEGEICRCPKAWNVGEERGLHKEILQAGYQ